MKTDTPRTDASLLTVAQRINPSVLPEMVYADLARKLERALNEALVKKQSILEQCVFEVEEAEKDLDRWRECARELAKIALKIRNDFLADNASVGNYSDGEFSQDYTTRVEGLQKALARFSELEKENKPQFSKPTETISFTCCGAGGHDQQTLPKAPCCAALLEIIKVCEEYQNADFEGKELEHQCDEGYRCSMRVVSIASAALQEHEAQHNGRDERQPTGE